MAMFKNPDKFQQSDEAKQLHSGSADPYSHVGFAAQSQDNRNYKSLAETNEASESTVSYAVRDITSTDPFSAVYDNLRNYGAATLVSVDANGQWISEVPQIVIDEIVRAEEKVAEDKRKAAQSRADAQKQAEEQTRQIAKQLGLSNFPKNLA